jgi:hypothetical protein
MSKVTGRRIWCVRDPGPESDMGDILFSTSLAMLPEYVVGTGLPRYRLKRHEFYDDYEEAVRDATARLVKRYNT